MTRSVERVLSDRETPSPNPAGVTGMFYWPGIFGSDVTWSEIPRKNLGIFDRAQEFLTASFSFVH